MGMNEHLMFSNKTF